MTARRYHTSAKARHKSLLDNAYVATLPSTVQRVRRFVYADRKTLLHMAEGVLSDKNRVANERHCVGAVKMLIALLPMSLTVIKRFLQDRDDTRAYELHFTIFCFLYYVPRMSLPQGVRNDIRDTVSKYLHNTDRDTRLAAWMAADLLGDHWKTAESLEVLLCVLRNGRYVAARRAAIHGIQAYLERGISRISLQERILKDLKEVSLSDRSRVVRSAAKRLISLGKAH